MILIIAPHPDDETLGMGGTISKYRYKESIEVMPMSWSFIKPLWEEFVKVSEILEFDIIKPPREFKRRNFPKEANEIRQVFYDMKGLYDKVFVPSTSDKHQDHQTVTKEAMRVFDCSIYGYHIMKNCVNPLFNYFESLSKFHFGMKLKAITSYESQYNRHFTKFEVQEGIAKTMGAFIKKPYAEAFEVIKQIR